MKRVLLLLLLISSSAFADVSSDLNITEVDGSPDVYPYKIKFSNASVTDNLDGTVTVATTGVAGPGSSTANAVAAWNGTGGATLKDTDLITGTSELSFGSAGVKFTGDGDGAITLLGLGNGNDENLVLNLDDTSNTAVFTSSTGVTLLDFQGMNLQSGGSGTPTITLGDNTTSTTVIKNDVSGTDTTLVGGSGEISADGVLAVGNNTAGPGTFKIYEDADNGSNFASMTVGSLAANTVYTLPLDDGDADQVLSTNGGGTLDWVTGSGGSPGGSNANVQYNSASAFAGDGAFSWNATTNSLGISRDVAQTGFAIVISSDTGASLAGISHDGTFTMTGMTSSGSVVVTGGTGYTTSGTILSTATGSMGWAAVDQTDNQACNTGCTSACVFGVENATGTAVTGIVSCDATTADTCMCAGSS